MLACEHSGQGRAVDHFSAFWPIGPARPVASPGRSFSRKLSEFGAVANERKSLGRRYRRHIRKTAYIAPRAARIRFRLTHGAKSTDRKTPRECARMEIRQDIHWFSCTGAQGTDYKRSEAFGQKMGRFQFCQGARHTCAPGQRRSYASPGKLSWGTHALSGTRYRAGIRPRVEQNVDAPRARRFAISRRRHYRRLPRHSRTGVVRRKKMEARSNLRSRTIKKILHRRLRRGRWWPCAPFRSITDR